MQFASFTFWRNINVVGFIMRFSMLLGLLSFILSTGHNDASQQRYARSVVNMDDLLKTEDDLVQNLEKYTAVLLQKARIIRW